MFNPVEFSFKIQQIAIEGAAASARMMVASYVRFIEQQSHLMEHALSGRRDEDAHNPSTQKKRKSTPARSKAKGSKRGKKSPCSGPDLLDHDGKRARDVDVEHI